MSPINNIILENLKKWDTAMKQILSLFEQLEMDLTQFSLSMEFEYVLPYICFQNQLKNYFAKKSLKSAWFCAPTWGIPMFIACGQGTYFMEVSIL